MLKLVSALSATLCLFVFSMSVKADHITITNKWSPETAPVARVMAAYMEIKNNSNKDSYITAINSPQFRKVEIHSMYHKDGMMRMEKQDQLKLAAGKTTSLEPGGYHVMLFNPKKWYQVGSKFTLNITLNNKNSFTVTVPVIKDQDGDQKHH